ncbi:chaperone protein dnaJ 16-like [Primulina tabacum]|uniref:chaperone protein dnaJ 16-like n=1 Tax=Primulina tabacum TaxID=48773 RepID=UPI003F5944D4
MSAVIDPDMAFFKKLDGFHPCEINELKAGTHYFAVYGDNFFKSISYTIEILFSAPFPEERENLRTVEAQILSKRVELSMFETEYRGVLAQFTEMTSRYAQEEQSGLQMLISAYEQVVAVGKKANRQATTAREMHDQLLAELVRVKELHEQDLAQEKANWKQQLNLAQTELATARSELE